MKKNQFIWFIVPLVFCLSVLTISCNQQNSSVAVNTREYIKNNCKDRESCKIFAKEMTHFEWDEFYVFEENVEDEEISKIIGKEIRTSTYSRKWIFLRNGVIVHKEEDTIEEVDVPQNTGDTQIIGDAEDGYIVIKPDAIFEIEKRETLELNNGEYFRLTCLNCKY